MSIVYTADVFCDGDCGGLWTDGAHKSHEPPTKGDARANARLSGWKHVSGKDYCPKCAQARGIGTAKA